VEDLPCELAGLLQDHPAVARVGVVAEVVAFVEEAPAFGVDADSPRIRVLLESVADGEVAELGRVALPCDGVAARPVAHGRGADRERHLDSVAGVEARPANLRQLPTGAQV